MELKGFIALCSRFLSLLPDLNFPGGELCQLLAFRETS